MGKSSLKKSRKPRVKKVKSPLTLHQLRVRLLRRASGRWPFKYACKNAAKVKKEIGKWKNGNIKYGVFYKCAHCNELFAKVQVDHIIPVVDVKEGFEDWNSFVPALLCELNNLQCLCKPCHGEKTRIENEARGIYRKERKSKKKLDKPQKKR